MAIAVVHKKQTGAGASGELAGLPAAAAGNLLVLFLAIQGIVEPEVVGDNTATGGWTIDKVAGHHALYNISQRSLWVATKTAVGGETSYSAAGAEPMDGICMFELSGTTGTKDVVVKTDNNASATTVTSPAITTTDAADVILACAAMGTAGGTIKAWSGTPALATVETVTSKMDGGSAVPGSKVEGTTVKAEWTTARASCLLVVTFKGGTSYKDAASGGAKASGTGSSDFYVAKDARTVTAKASGTAYDALKASDKPMGGAKAGGVRSDVYKASDARSGGAVAGGTATDSGGLSDSRSGGAKASGNATSSYKAADARSGGATATGTRSESLTKAGARAGGATAAGSFTQAYKASDVRSGGAKAGGSRTESWTHLGFFFDSGNGTVHAGGQRADVYKAADVSHGAAKASSAARDVYKAIDAHAGTVTANGTRSEAIRFIDARTCAAALLGTSSSSQTHSDAHAGSAIATGGRVEELLFTDVRNGIVVALGSGAENYTATLKPAVVTIRLRHSARIEINLAARR